MADEVDLYGDEEDDFNQEYNHDNVDLYDDVLTGPSEEGGNNDEGQASSENSYTDRRHYQNRRYSVYIGNLTWWTTDEDLGEAARSIGAADVDDIKFFENRANGQSKGFCQMSMSSEGSYRTVLEKLSKKVLHGKNPEVLACTKQNLGHFESISRKGSSHGGGAHGPQGNYRYDNAGGGERFSRENHRDREWERDPNRGDRNRGSSVDRNRGRPTGPPPGSAAPNQRHHANPNMNHPPPPQAMPPQYPPGPGRAPWMGPPPPQMYQMPRPGMPPNTGAPPPPPPGLQAPPPPRPIPPPHANVRVPPPRGPPPPMGPRNIPPPDPRGPPPHHDWERMPGTFSQPPPQVGMPSQPSGPPNRPLPPVPPPGQNMPPAIHPPPAPHINPAFFMSHNQGISPVMPPATQPLDVYARPPPVQYPEYRPSNESRNTETTPAVNEGEFEDIMTRNRTVSSSAIARAVADASAGDFTSAIETLVTAISLIKQSKIANDERCKILISSLQDTLHGVEAKSYSSSSSSSRNKERPRSRERSRERSSRRDKSSRRDRSRSRDYRDRSRERDRYHEERYREKDTDRDRDRERRSHRH